MGCRWALPGAVAEESSPSGDTRLSRLESCLVLVRGVNAHMWGFHIRNTKERKRKHGSKLALILVGFVAVVLGLEPSYAHVLSTALSLSCTHGVKSPAP